ncbi:MAG: ABC transporter ATP-binding protein [Actinomycetota bacterium]
MSVLAAEGLTAGFGSTQVLHGVSLQIEQRECAAILGLNGAGKSVTMKVLSGLVPTWGGTITLNGSAIQKLEAEQRVARGMAFMTQGRQVFPEMSVQDNLRLGAYMLRRRNRAEYPAALNDIYERFPRLSERKDQAAGTLSGGEQAMLALARALISKPSILLIDEPTAGLAPIAVEGFLQTLHEIRKTGLTMLLVEQNVAFALELADRVNIMQRGQIVYESAIKDLDRDQMMRYLGIGRLLAPTIDAAAASRKASSNGHAKTKRTKVKR